MFTRCLAAGLTCASLLWAQVPENLVTEGIPELSPDLKADARRYLEFRSAVFQSWHPTRRELLITTRFCNAAQLHLVNHPGGARRQLTFLPEPVAGGSFQPKTATCIVFSQDAGGGEFFQLHRLDMADGKITRLTDGKSRNTGPRWAPSGRQLAYSSTRRNGRDTDIYLIDPMAPTSDHLLLQLEGGGWSVTDWSPDERRLLLLDYVSINESSLHVADLTTGEIRAITPRGSDKVAYGRAQFSKDGRSIFTTTDKDSEFRRLVRIDLPTGAAKPLTPETPWDIEDFELAPDGKTIALVANAAGESRLHLLDTRNGRLRPIQGLAAGVIAGIQWHENGREFAFTQSDARSPGDTWSLEIKSGRFTRWTDSETGGLNPGNFAIPQLVEFPSIDGRKLSAFVYRPDPAKFPGPRPVIVSIHGGPEGQSRPGFLARNNYFLNEMGVAMVVPNVRGSDGYGKTFLALDNGFRREDSVKDIGAVLDWISRDAGLDTNRVAVTGGSYGGYMTLASLAQFGDRFRCGIDVVGISNFVTFLENTQEYRRDLRRVEYGDERDPAMREFLTRISPTTNVRQILQPLFIVQGRNDPRVPVTEALQIFRAIRDNGGTAWYLEAKDEGHGFAKKPNQDFQFYATIRFLKDYLLH